MLSVFVKDQISNVVCSLAESDQSMVICVKGSLARFHVLANRCIYILCSLIPRHFLFSWRSSLPNAQSAWNFMKYDLWERISHTSHASKYETYSSPLFLWPRQKTIEIFALSKCFPHGTPYFPKDPVQQKSVSCHYSGLWPIFAARSHTDTDRECVPCRGSGLCAPHSQGTVCHSPGQTQLPLIKIGLHACASINLRMHPVAPWNVRFMFIQKTNILNKKSPTCFQLCSICYYHSRLVLKPHPIL